MDSAPTREEQFYNALKSVCRGSHGAIEKVLTMINEGGKDFLMESEHIMFHAISRGAPLEIIHKMTEVGGKDFVMKTNFICMMNPTDTCLDVGTPLHGVFDDSFLKKFQLEAVLPKFLEVGGKDLVMKRTVGGERTALHRACTIPKRQYLKHKEAIKQLIEFGGKELVMAKDTNGDTALSYAENNPISLEIMKAMIDIGGADLLKEKNFYYDLVVQAVALSERKDNHKNDQLRLLIKEGIHHNVYGEFSFGGLLKDDIHSKAEEFYLKLWYPALKDVYYDIQNESPDKTPPFLHTMIMVKAPKEMILNVLDDLNGIVSIKDTSGRYAIDVAIETNLPFDEGMKEILEVTAKTNGWDIRHCAAHHGLPWKNEWSE